jgi:hypothetical protein
MPIYSVIIQVKKKKGGGVLMRDFSQTWNMLRKWNKKRRSKKLYNSNGVELRIIPPRLARGCSITTEEDTGCRVLRNDLLVKAFLLREE